MQISDVVPEVSRTSQSVLDVSQTDHEVAQVMMPVSHWDFKAEMAWRVIGLMSSVVGLLCYALSPSFNRLIGRWKPFKVFLYAMSSLVIFTTVLFAKQSSLSTQLAQLIKTCAIFAVLMIIAAYSFVYDRAVNGKPDILSVVSNAAFAFVSLSLHKLFKLKSEMGVFSYFLCCFTVQLLTINGGLIIVAIIFGFLLSYIHSSPNFATGRQDRV